MEITMDHEKNKFSYNLTFHDALEGSRKVHKRHDVFDFAPAQTAEEAVKNLAKVLDGSMPFKLDLAKGVKANLTCIQLMGDGKELFKLHATEGTESLFGLPWFKKPTASVHWGWMDFDNVSREIFDALVKTFPEQKKIFKGKFLEDALAL
jgi:hypothetical protein